MMLLIIDLKSELFMTSVKSVPLDDLYDGAIEQN